MLDLDSLSGMWEPDREFLLWQRKTWHERPRWNSVVHRVTIQATGSIKGSLCRVLREVNLVGLCRQCSRFRCGRAGSSRSDRRRRLTDHADCRLTFRAKRGRRLARRWWCAVWESCIHPGIESVAIASVVCKRHRNARFEDWRTVQAS